MNCTCRFGLAGVGAAIAIAGTLAFAQTPTPKERPTPPTAPSTPTAKPSAPKPTTPPPGEMQLPPGMTAEDMQACMEAGTPGEMHAFLGEAAGEWHGKSKMWMTPEAPPMESECTAKFSMVMDGRYLKCQIDGEMPGMGPFNGLGVYGYDNVAQTFQASWIDNCSTGIMQGTGELSSDKKTLTWNFKYHCPITKKQTTMREVEKITGKNTRTLEMYGVNPKTGEEYKMMEIAFTRKAGSPAAASATGTRN